MRGLGRLGLLKREGEGRSGQLRQAGKGSHDNVKAHDDECLAASAWRLCATG